MRFVHVEITGHRDAAGRFARATDELVLAQREAMRELGRKEVNALRAEAPFRTGRLRAGIRYRTVQGTDETKLTVTSAAPYTKWVIYGRGPVVAKRAKALRFEPGPPGSGFIFRRRVGPSKPNPFHRRAQARLGMEPAQTANRIARMVLRAYSQY